MERQVTHAQIADASNDALRNSMHHVMPGRVVSYDAGQETVSVQPGTNDVRFDLDTGARVSEPWGVLQGVPVAWPRFGGFVIKASLNKYDAVMLVAVDLDPGPWRQAGRTLKPVDPGDVRRHGPGYWFAIPTDISLNRTPSSPGTLTIGAEGEAPAIVITGSTIQLGSSGGDFLALASKVDACMNLIKAHIHISAASGAPTGPPLTPPTTPLSLPATGSALVKAQ